MQKSNSSKNQMEVTWLITGGWGFIGTNLREFIAHEYPDHRVGVVDINRKYNHQFSDRSKAMNVNVANWRAMDRAFMKFKPTYVIHLAAETGVRKSMQNPGRCFEKNFLGTLNCLDHARRYGAEAVVIASSCGVAGEQFCSVDEEARCDPESPYSYSKLCSEELGNCYRKLGLRVCNLRFANTYGPWSDHKDNAIPKFIKAFLAGEPLKVNGTGEQARNFIYVKDVVRAIDLCLKKEANGTYCIASDNSITINDLISVISEVGGSEVDIEFGEGIEGDIIDIQVSNSKARRELMFQCEYTIMTGITVTMEWFRRLKSGLL